MKNREIADVLDRMGTLLEMKDENVFKIRAYHKAAEAIMSLAEDIEMIKEENRLSQIPGIGKTLETKIAEYIDTGRMSAYESLVKEIPESLLDVINIPSVGPKKAKLFYEKLKVKNVDDLQKAAEKGKLLGLPGVKEKTVENIISGIRVVKQGQERMNLGTASRVADEIVAVLKSLPEVKKISSAGSLRRMKETVRDIDILIDSSNSQKVMDTFVSLPQVKKINAHGDTKSSVLTNENVQVDLRVVESKSFGAALLYFTGSKNFNVKLRQIAIKKNKKVNEYGVFSIKGKREKCVASQTEGDCFKALGLPTVPPELREDIGEAEFFSKLKIPKLIEAKEIKGDLHVHSTWSDGKNSILEMAQTARKRGYSYVAICDHSPRLRVARGVSVADLKKKKKEIDQVNKKMKNFQVLYGTEVEIDSNGGLDYNSKVLSEFDIVIAAIHSGFEQKEKQLTSRLIKACQNKYVTAIAHPTGVHLGKRDPYPIDFHAVCKAAVDTNTFLEINASPVRLDLNSNNVYYAKKLGVKFVVNTDSHNVDQMRNIKFGVAIARRGWLTKNDVANTSTWNQLKKMKK